MADKKIQMTQRNATNDAWDNLYPKTTGDQVVASDGMTTFNIHLTDRVNHVPYGGVTTGTANTYAVTLNPAPTSYVDGMAISVKINIDGSAASTINVNSLGAKAIKKANGTDVTNLKTNGVYTLRYNSTTGNFILQGEGGNGNATASDLYSDKTATTDVEDIIGTNPYKSGIPVNVKNNTTLGEFIIKSRHGTPMTQGPTAYGFDKVGNLYSMYTSSIKRILANGHQAYNVTSWGNTSGDRIYVTPDGTKLVCLYYYSSLNFCALTLDAVTGAYIGASYYSAQYSVMYAVTNTHVIIGARNNTSTVSCIYKTALDGTGQITLRDTAGCTHMSGRAVKNGDIIAMSFAATAGGSCAVIFYNPTTNTIVKTISIPRTLKDYTVNDNNDIYAIVDNNNLVKYRYSDSTKEYEVTLPGDITYGFTIYYSKKSGHLFVLGQESNGRGILSELDAIGNFLSSQAEYFAAYQRVNPMELDDRIIYAININGSSPELREIIEQITLN